MRIYEKFYKASFSTNLKPLFIRDLPLWSDVEGCREDEAHQNGDNQSEDMKLEKGWKQLLYLTVPQRVYSGIVRLGVEFFLDLTQTLCNFYICQKINWFSCIF